MCIEIVPSCTKAKNHAIWRLCKRDYKAPRYLMPALLISSTYLEALLVQPQQLNAVFGPHPSAVGKWPHLQRRNWALSSNKCFICMSREQSMITRSSLMFVFFTCPSSFWYIAKLTHLYFSQESIALMFSPSFVLSENTFSFTTDLANINIAIQLNLKFS